MKYYYYWMRQAAMMRWFWKHSDGDAKQIAYREMMGDYRQAQFFKWEARYV